jgi:alpha-galactosidase
MSHPEPTAQETARARAWADARFLSAIEPPPFSFQYGGAPAPRDLTGWVRQPTERSPVPGGERLTVSWRDPATGLELLGEAVVYGDHPAVEWVCRFRHRGAQDTPIIERPLAIDLRLTRAEPGIFVVHHGRGSQAHPSDFEPLETPLEIFTRLSLHSGGVPTCADGSGGSPSVESLPFFLIDWGDEGVVAGLGWTGPWTAGMTRPDPRGLDLRAGTEGIRLRLRPGEEIRGPRVVLLFWNGPPDRAWCLWRRLLLDHYSPRPGGKPFPGLLCDSLWGSWTNAEGHIAQIRRWRDEELPVECYWMDAGWCGDMQSGWAAHQSDRRPDQRLFPNGMRPVADAAHAQGMSFLLWFVPESVQPGIEIGASHPEWVLEPFRSEAYDDNTFYGLDHGDPKVNAFLVDYYAELVEAYGLDVLRVDGLSLWPRDPAPDRQGINQSRYTEGLYAFWDGLLARCPSLLIDNCGTGARRLDLETIKRSICFWRSDCQASARFDPLLSQNFTQGLAPWLPLFGSAVPMHALSPYSFRSGYAPVLQMTWPAGDPAARWTGLDLALLGRLMREYLELRPLLFGDFRALTRYGPDNDVWSCWQWDRPDLGRGMVQAFRRPECGFDTLTIRLRGLCPDARYQINDRDRPGLRRADGGELMDKGLHLSLATRPASSITVYERLD